MKSLVFKVLWYFIHIIASLIEFFHYFGLEFRENFFNFIKIISQDDGLVKQDSELQLIEKSIQELEKIPEHIAVLLNINHEKDVDLSKLTKLIDWSMSSGVHFISFYDYKGILKHQLASSFHQLIQKKLSVSDKENIVWGPSYYQSSSEIGDINFPHRNGYRRHIVVNLYSSEDSYQMFNKLLTNETCSKEMINNKTDDDRLTSENITVENVDSKLRKIVGNLPDPELAVYFGNFTCTAGLLPWQIRLTEFIQISYRQSHLSLNKYLRVLYKYAKCEQRFGK